MENLIIEEFKFEANTLNVNVFNKKKNKFEDPTNLSYDTFEEAKEFFNVLVGALINIKGFKKVMSSFNSNTYIELENDVYHIQLSIFE